MAGHSDGDDPAAPLAFGKFELEGPAEALPKSVVKAEAEGPHLFARLLACLLQPWHWLLGLAKELNASFVSGIIVVYGVSQGFGGAFNRVVVDYYWKDVQGAAPWQVQLYTGITFFPWNVKPLYGFLTDAFPVAGYRRRPYFILPGLLSLAAVGGIVLGGKLHPSIAVALFTCASLAVAIADVTIDADVARKTREHRHLGPDMQSLCSACSSVGALVGFASSGVVVYAVGSQGAIGLLVVPAALFLILGLTYFEELHIRDKQVWERIRQVMGETWATLQHREVWRPTLYMFLSWALCPRITEAKFFWYTDKKIGPGFSQEFIGVMYAIGSVGALGAAFLYNAHLRNCSFRSVLKWTQLVMAASGMLDLLLVFRVNLKMHIPDMVFVLLDESLTVALYRLKWMPLLVMCAMLCPPGIEGTFFAFLMSVDNLGTFAAQINGGILLKLCNVVRPSSSNGPGQTNFQLLWLAIVIRNLMLLLPLCFLRMVPDAGPNDEILVDYGKEAIPCECNDDVEDNTQEAFGHAQILLEKEPLNH